MGELSEDLSNMGYEPTDRDSPFDDDGKLWTKGYELVCDETGVVISDDSGDTFFRNQRDGDDVYRYHNSDRVKLVGGFTGSYEWGTEDSRFYY